MKNALRSILRKWDFLLSIPNTVHFNLRYFPFRTALKLPVFVSHRVQLKELSGTVELQRIRTGIVKIGMGDGPLFHNAKSKSILIITGKVIFEGTADIGPGCQIAAHGELFVGNNFAVTGFSMIYAKTKISFGRNVLISWDVSVFDQDWHDICDAQGTVLNPPKPIIIGDNVWLCCRTLILKGSKIKEGVVVAAGTTVAGRVDVSHAVIGGSPNIRVIKEGIFWKH
ncbi:MAG: acyltransferase [Nibricoccus sp.]